MELEPKGGSRCATDDRSDTRPLFSTADATDAWPNPVLLPRPDSPATVLPAEARQTAQTKPRRGYSQCGFSPLREQLSRVAPLPLAPRASSLRPCFLSDSATRLPSRSVPPPMWFVLAGMVRALTWHVCSFASGRVPCCLSSARRVSVRVAASRETVRQSRRRGSSMLLALQPRCRAWRPRVLFILTEQRWTSLRL